MATAAELLAAKLSTDKTLVIDNDFRTIKIPSSITNLGVESDDEVLRLHFRMPRYLGKTDLSTFAIRINYLNAKGEGDVYSVSDMAIVGDNLTFSWLVGPNATKYKGDTKFNVCMKIVDGDGYIQKEYNTTIASLPVLEGLETEEGLIEFYSDILEQWKNQLFGIGDTEETKLTEKSEEEQENIAQKGIEVLATIPEDYQTTYEMANNAYRTRANAIVSTVQGESIYIDDASDDPLRGLRVFGKTTQVTTTGKNLFNVSAAIANQKRGTTAVSDYFAYGNGVKVNTNGYDNGRAYMYLTLEAGTYTISADVIVGANWNCSVKNYDTDTELINSTSSGDGHISHSFTIDTTALIGFCFMCVVTKGPSTTTTNIQLEVGSAETEYEPYSGGVASPSPVWPQELESVENPTVSVLGKNLIPFPYYELAETKSGVTFTVNNDGTITLNGTPTAATSFILANRSDSTIPVKHGRHHFFRALTTAGSLSTVYAYVSYNGKSPLFDVGDGVSFIPEEDGYATVCIVVAQAAGTLNNVVIKPQLEISEVATEYEPYKTAQTIVEKYPLRGIPVTIAGNYTDSNGQQWICDEVDFERGVYIQRVNVATLGGDAYTEYLYSEKMGCGQLVVAPNPAKNQSVYGTACNIATRNDVALESVDGQYYENPANIVLVGSADDTDITIRAKYESLELIYVLATPIETELTPEELVAFGKIHSNYPNTTMLNDSGAWMEVKYNEDLKLYANEIMEDAAETVITPDKIQNAVDTWLSAHYSAAEGVSF